MMAAAGTPSTVTTKVHACDGPDRREWLPTYVTDNSRDAVTIARQGSCSGPIRMTVAIASQVFFQR
jgi:hypothetical protein